MSNFNIPLPEPMRKQGLAINRYLREISDSSVRASLIHQHRGDPLGFEQLRGLPQGAFELLTMLESEDVKALDARFKELIARAAKDPAAMEELRNEGKLAEAQLKERYPYASAFAKRYSEIVFRGAGTPGGDGHQPEQFVFLIVAVAVFVGVAALVVAAANAAAVANAVVVANAITVVNIVTNVAE